MRSHGGEVAKGMRGCLELGAARAGVFKGLKNDGVLR